MDTPLPGRLASRNSVIRETDLPRTARPFSRANHPPSPMLSFRHALRPCSLHLPRPPNLTNSPQTRHSPARLARRARPPKPPAGHTANSSLVTRPSSLRPQGAPSPFVPFVVEIPPSICRARRAHRKLVSRHCARRGAAGSRTSGSGAGLHPQVLRYFRGCGILPRHCGWREGGNAGEGNPQECLECRLSASDAWETGGMSTMKPKKTASRTGTLEKRMGETTWTNRDNAFQGTPPNRAADGKE